MSIAPFPIDPALTGIVIAYRNTRLVADAVLPRIPVGKQEFRWLKHNLTDGFSIPETRVGRKSTPNQVEFSATEVAGFCKDYGLDDVVPQNDIDNADSRFDPVANAAVRLRELVALAREQRVAASVFASGSYAAGNSTTLSGTSQWSDYTNSNPINAILTAMDAMVVRPNRAVIGRQAFTVLRQHPKVIEAIKATGAGGANAYGVVTAQQIADALELDSLQVGESFLNTAAKGQTPTLSRVWGKHFAMYYQEALATNTQGMTFGYTAEWGSPFAGQMPTTENAGLLGGVKVRVGERVSEVIAANDLGYLFLNCVA